MDGPTFTVDGTTVTAGAVVPPVLSAGFGGLTIFLRFANVVALERGRFFTETGHAGLCPFGFRFSQYDAALIADDRPSLFDYHCASLHLPF